MIISFNRIVARDDPYVRRALRQERRIVLRAIRIWLFMSTQRLDSNLLNWYQTTWSSVFETREGIIIAVQLVQIFRTVD